MKNSTTSKKTTNNISPTSKKKQSIGKKTKEKVKCKNWKDLIKHDSVQVNEHSSKQQINDKNATDKQLDKIHEKNEIINDKPVKQKKKNEAKQISKKSKKDSSTDDKRSMIVNKTTSTKSNEKSINKSKTVNKANKQEKQINSKKKQSKDDKKSSSKSSSKNSNNSSASAISKNHKKEDKKLAALLQLQEMRPRGPRLASLNASCKMQLLYESEREKINDAVLNMDNLDSETDASTEELDDREDEKDDLTSTKVINDDLLTEDDDDDALNIDEVITIKKDEPKTEERDLLSESINSVINSINNSLKKKEKSKQPKDSSSTLKKKKKVVDKEDEAKRKSDDETDSEIVNTPSANKSSKQPKTPKDNQKSTKKSLKAKEKSSTFLSKKDKKDAKDKKSLKDELKIEPKNELKTESKSESKVESNSKNNKESKSKVKRKKKKTLVKESMIERKRKLEVDDSVELIDTRSTKRLASLNASAIMAASYQDEKLNPPLPLQVATIKSTSPAPASPKYQEKHVEVIHKTTTVTNNEVTETIKMFKKVHHVSGKIRDRLLAIEMMENENTDNTDDDHSVVEHISDDEHIDDNCIIEEPETEDEQDEIGAKGKSVLQKKISATNASSKQKSSEVIEEVNSSYKPSSSYVSSSNRNDAHQVTSMTKTTKVKINKKKNNEKTTVEKYKYEVAHSGNGAFNSLNAQQVDNLRAVTYHPGNVPSNTDHLSEQTTNLNGQQQTATQFIPLQANPYASPGYCIYSNALQLAYHQQLQQQQLAYQQLQQQAHLYQQPQATNLSQFYSAPANHQAAETLISQHLSPSSSSLNLSSSGTNVTTTSSSNSTTNTKQSYKSAFSVPQNSASTSSASTANITTTSSNKHDKTKTNSTSESSSTPKVNGVYQLPKSSAASLMQPVNDNSYLIHKPLAFNAATGNPIQYNSSANNVQLNQLKSQQSAILHPVQQTSNLLTPQNSSLVPAMQCFPNALTANPPYIFQYPTHGLAHPQASDLASQLNAFHQSQTQLPNSSALISPASQYSSAFQPNLNIAFIPGQTPFLSATQQLAAQAPMFIGNPLNTLGNAFPNFCQTVDPTSISSIGVLGSAVNIITKDSPDLIVVGNNNLTTTTNLANTNLNATNLITTTTELPTTLVVTNMEQTSNVPVKVTDSPLASSITKDRSSKKSTKDTSIMKKLERNKKLLTEKPISLTLNHTPVNLNELTCNTTTTTSTQTKSAVIKIKPPQSSSNGRSKNLTSLAGNNGKVQLKSDNSTSNKKSKSKNGDIKQVQQNGNVVKNKSLATGIRKNRDKKMEITSSKLNNCLNNNSIKINNQNFTKSTDHLTKTNLQTNNFPKTRFIINNQQSLQKSFLPCPAPEPLITNQLNYVGSNKSLMNTNVVLMDANKATAQQQQPSTKKESLTIVLNNKKDNSPSDNKASVTSNNAKKTAEFIIKRSNDMMQQEPAGSKKLKIDLQTKSNSTTPSNSLNNQSVKSVKNTITITPITMNTTSNSTTSNAAGSRESLTTVQLDTASMRTKKSTTTNMNNNMLNQTGKFLTIHPSNFYSNGALASNATLKKLTSTDLRPTLNQLNNSNSSSKINDVCLNTTNDLSMKGFKKASKSTNQVKQAEKIPEHELLISHGWKFQGPSTKKMVMISENNNQIRETYTSIRHIQGEVIHVRDCALLRSGPKINEPFVAKITALYEDPSTNAMMMNLLWYYRPEHTDLNLKPNESNSEEIFASKHRDVNSVACIDDRCYVLTFNEYCRFRKKQKMIASGVHQSFTDIIVPKPTELYPRLDKQPSDHTSTDIVFCCRKVYDVRNKRILKNPS